MSSRKDRYDEGATRPSVRLKKRVGWNAPASRQASELASGSGQGRRRFSLASLIPIAIIVALCGFAFFYVSTEHKSYTMPRVDIEANVRADGTLHVVEQRTFDFHGSYSAVWWTIDTVPFDSKLVVDGISLGQGWNADKITLSDVPEVPFDITWRTAGGPSTTAYSVDEPKKTVYVFASALWTKQIVRFEYEIPNFAQRYDDCADVYWQFIEPKWAVDSKNVTCVVHLPVPEGESVRAADNVFAWGHKSHGITPSDNVAFDEAAGSIMFTIPKVESGSYAEARVVFPSEWLTEAPEPSHIEQLDHIRSEELELWDKE